MTSEQQKHTGMLHALANRRIAVMLPLGFASGLPLALTGQTLQARLSVENVALGTIGFFTLVGLPYIFKFLWAPIMDRFVPPWLGRRRGWMVLTQVGLLAGIACMAVIGPAEAIWLLGVMALTVAFISASQDIAFDAYRADVLREQERGFGAGVSVTSYRIAMLVAGGLALILAEHMGWLSTYLIMAGLMIVGMAGTLVSPEPDDQPVGPSSLLDAVWEPLKEFCTRSPALGLMLLIVLYKFGDAFAGSLTTAFLLRGVEFSLSEVGLVNKWLGLGSTIVGALAGGALMVRLGLFRSLMLFGVLQALSNLSFMALAWVGKSFLMLVVAVVLENFSGGMGTAAFVGLLMGLCDHRFTAFQYALFSALASVGRVLIGPPSGVLVDAVGWVMFFFITFLFAIPGLCYLWFLRNSVGQDTREVARYEGIPSSAASSWLGMFIFFTLIVAPISYVILWTFKFKQFVALQAALPTGMHVAFYLGSVAELALLLLAVYVGVALVRKQDNAPRLAMILLTIDLFVSLVFANGMTVASVRVIIDLLWMAYFLRSQRVAAIYRFTEVPQA